MGKITQINRQLELGVYTPYTPSIEVLDAADWYNQRVGVCKDMPLRTVLAHNRDEE